MTDVSEVTKIRARIAAIDTMFEEANGWGSWMSSASNERRQLVNRLLEYNIIIAHKYELKVGSDISEVDLGDHSILHVEKPTEPEIEGIDGTTRKAHYGAGRQPWDDIKDAGWAAPFAAGNALKYIRRAATKNGGDDVKKGQWYYNELNKLATKVPGGDVDEMIQTFAVAILNQLDSMLTPAERGVLQEGLEA